MTAWIILTIAAAVVFGLAAPRRRHGYSGNPTPRRDTATPPPPPKPSRGGPRTAA